MSDVKTAPEKPCGDAVFSGGDLRKTLQLMRDKTGIQRSASAKRCRAARKEAGPLVHTARSLRLPARTGEVPSGPSGPSGHAEPKSSPKKESDVPLRPTETKAAATFPQATVPKSPLVSPVLGVRHVLQETHFNISKAGSKPVKPVSAPPSPGQWVRRSPLPQNRNVLRSMSPPSSPPPPLPRSPLLSGAEGPGAKETVPCTAIASEASEITPAPVAHVEEEATATDTSANLGTAAPASRSPPAPWQCPVGVQTVQTTVNATTSPCALATRVEGVRSCHDGIRSGKAGFVGTFAAGAGPCGTWSPAPSFLLPPRAATQNLQPPQLRVARVCATPPPPFTPIMHHRDGREEARPVQRTLLGRTTMAIPWFPKTDLQTPKVCQPPQAVSRAMFAGSPTRRRQINV